VPDKGGDSDLGEPKIVRDACEAVPQYMRRDIRQCGIAKDLIPMIGKATERIIVALAWEDVIASFSHPSPFQKLHHRQPDGPGGGTLLTFGQTQAARLHIGFHPPQLDHFRTAASGESNLADDISRHLVSLVLSRFTQDSSKGAILSFG
jgi:hypothetical protein